jgi:hypothetical protein
MKLTPTQHAWLDYATVIIFAVAPSLLGLSGIAAMLSYTLAGVHLLVTLLTAFPGGVWPVIPFRLHGFIEMAVGPTLLAAPWLLGFTGNARMFYSAMGVVILLVWLITDYAGASKPASA